MVWAPLSVLPGPDITPRNQHQVSQLLLGRALPACAPETWHYPDFYFSHIIHHSLWRLVGIIKYAAFGLKYVFAIYK